MTMAQVQLAYFVAESSILNFISFFFEKIVKNIFWLTEVS